MSSPQKRLRHVPTAPTHRVAESALPLNLALAWLAVRALPYLNPSGPPPIYSSTFTAAILKAIATEILEINDSPITYAALKTATDAILRQEVAMMVKANMRMEARGQTVPQEREELARYHSSMKLFADSFSDIADGCTCIDFIEVQIRERVNETDDYDIAEMREPIERHSLLGVFLRGLGLTLRKLSFEETSHLARQVGQWCGSLPDASSSSVHIFSLNRKLAMDDNLDSRSKAMADYRKAEAAGDYSKALRSLRRLYDYQSPMGGHGQHQHALLNLANFHHSTGGLEVAKSLVEEAIRVARGEGDKACLQRCMSLLSRINPTSDNSPSTSRNAPTDPTSSQTPMDELWNVKMATASGEPIHSAITHVHLALARYEGTARLDHRDVKDGWAGKNELDLATWHATQAGLGNLIGSPVLGHLHGSMALDRVDDTLDGRLTVLILRAQTAMKRADFTLALGVLLDQTTTDALDITSYRRWCDAIWDVLQTQADLSGDTTGAEIISSLRGSCNPPEILERDETIDVLLRKVKKMLAAELTPHTILSDILSAIHLASSLSQWSSYRYGIVLLADVLLRMEGANLAAKAKAEVERIWDQILGEGDEDVIALGMLVLGKAELDLALDSVGSYDTAEAHLREALKHATKLQYKSIILQSTTLLAMISDLRGETHERDHMTTQWAGEVVGGDSTTKFTKRHDDITKIGEVVQKVGLRVVQGRTQEI